MNDISFYPTIIFLLILSFLFIFSKKVQTGLRMMASVLPFNFLRIIFFRLGGTIIGKSVHVSMFSRISKDVVIQDNVIVGYNVTLSRGTFLGNGVIVENNCNLSLTEVMENTIIHHGTVSFGNRDRGKVLIGANGSIGHYCILDGTGGLSIGKGNHIGSFVTFWTHSAFKSALKNIDFTDPSYTENLLIKSVSTGNNIWIGKGVTIFPGVIIGNNSAILPHSLIVKDVKPLSIVQPQITLKTIATPRVWREKNG